MELPRQYTNHKRVYMSETAVKFDMWCTIHPDERPWFSTQWVGSSGSRRHYSGRRNQASRLVIRFPHALPAPEKDTPVVFHLNPAMQTGSCGSLGLGRAELQRHKQVDRTKFSDTSESCIVQRRKVNHMKSSDIISESHEASGEK